MSRPKMHYGYFCQIYRRLSEIWGSLQLTLQRYLQELFAHHIFPSMRKICSMVFTLDPDNEPNRIVHIIAS